jgi:membrane protein DedA with SNARE-associated domain
VDLLPTLGLLGLLLVKEAGLPVPVPGDLLVLGAGIAAAAAGPGALVLLGAILVAGFVGGSIQFALVRGTLRDPLLRVLGRFGVPLERIESLSGWLRERGARGVAVARSTPGLRIGAIAASGMAALPFRAFLTGLVGGNTLFVGGHFALGFVVGPPAMSVVTGASGPLLAVGALVGLSILGAAVWAALRRRRATARRAAEPTADLPTLGTWTEAACPACIAIGVIRGARS